MNKEYKFYKYENNPEGSDYCFCQRPIDSNMSLRCFLENGEILGFMSESLVFEHSEIKEIDMNEFMFDFVRLLIKENTNLKQELNEISKIIRECKELMPHEFDWEEQTDNILQIIDKVLGDE